MDLNEMEPELLQFDRRQQFYLNLSCIFVVLAFTVLLANPVWGSAFALLFFVVTIALLRACFTHEIKRTDDNTLASN
ncbi:MAG: hypothetical protein ACFFEA_12930 [Candidatus Thorarchaeota archaeon]